MKLKRLGIGLTATALFAVASVFAAAPADAANTQKLTPRSYVMPAGDHGLAATGKIRQFAKTPRRIPGGNAALQAIKAGPGGSAEGMVTLSELGADGPESRGLSTTCTTNSAVGFAPSDIHGASSATRLVVVTNVEVGIYNATNCALISKVPLKTFFGAFAPPATETQFDPRVIFDRRSNRFIVTTESRDSGNTDQFQYFAVSTSSGATAWNLYRVVLSRVSTGTVFCKESAGSFWDYPQAGVSNTRIFFVANDFGASVNGHILDIDKTPTLTGGSTTARCFPNLIFNLAPPQVLDASTTATFLSPGTGSGSSVVRLDLIQGAGVGNDVLVARPSFAIAAWSAAPDAPQPNGQVLDTLDGRFQNASLQSRGLLWNIHAVNIGGAAKIRWYKFNATSTTSSTTALTTTFQTSSADRLFNPSITTASALFNAPAYIETSRTIPTITTGAGNAASLIMYGLNSDPSAPNWTFVVAGTSASQFTGCPCRWGDYSSVTVDPTNNGVAWGFNQLVTGTSQFNWTTRAGKALLTLPVAPTN